MRMSPIVLALALGLAVPTLHAAPDAPALVIAQDETLEGLILRLESHRNEGKPAVSASEAESLNAAIESRGSGDRTRADYARALVLMISRDAKSAREIARTLVKAQPKVAAYQVLLGTSIFLSIQGEGELTMMSLADEAKAAYENAVELDSTLVEPRIGLAQYYINAPALLGGSYRKARQQGEALIAIPGGKGVYNGRLILAQIAGAKEEWDEMTVQLRQAEKAPGDEKYPFLAKRTHASMLLRLKKDPAAALAMVTQAEPLAPPDDVQLLAIKGQSQAQLKQWGPAAETLTRVIELNEGAQLSRYVLGEALENLGKLAEARVQYSEYVTRFPKGERADDANSALKRIDKKLKR